MKAQDGVSIIACVNHGVHTHAEGGQTARGPDGPYLPKLRSNAADQVVDASRLTLFERASKELGRGPGFTRGRRADVEQTWSWVWIPVRPLRRSCLCAFVATSPLPKLLHVTCCCAAAHALMLLLHITVM